jgi:hypothetical protein
MTNRFLISVAALALIAGTGLASAQGTGGKESGGAQMQSAPSSVGGGGAGSAATEHREGNKGAGNSSGMNAEQKSSTTGQGQHTEENAPGGKSKSMSSENEMKGDAKSNMKAEGREDRNPNKSTEKNAQTQGRETNQNAQDREGRGINENAQNREGRDANMKEGREGRDTNMNAQTRTGTETNTVGQAGAPARLSTDQRNKIVNVFRGEHVAPVKNVHFSVTVGTRVPREHVSLRPLPSEVVIIYPEWRGYEFFLVGDKIVVVDPRTLEIVDVLPA